MNALVMAVLAAGAAGGALLAVAGLTGHEVLPSASLPGPGRGAAVRWRLLAAALAAGCVTFVTTGWWAGAALVVVAVVAGPRVLGGKAAREAAIARTEAVAAWTEMVRDSIAAASGLEEAIVATEPVAPAPIASEVRALARRLEHQGLADALEAFAADVRHPSADLVVAALVIAARSEASDLTGLLSRLADAIRDDARMRIRVEVGRTRVRTAAKVIAGVVGATLLMLAVANRDYLDAYDGPAGQLVLVIVAGIFVAGGWLLERMARIELPERFTSRAGAGEPAPW